MTNVNEIYQSKYLSYSDLQGKEPVVTITQVEIAKMDDGEVKLCIYVNNKPKGIILNKTNAKSIAALYGDETGAWVGKHVKLVTVWTEFQGKPVQAIRIVPPVVDTMQQRGGADDWQAPSASPPPAKSADDFGARLEDDIPF